jgi:hypothetical protein
MHKFPLPIAHDAGPKRPRAKLIWSLSLVGLGLLLAPFVAEGTALCVAQWRQVLGENSEAKTPILNSVADSAEATHRSFWDCIDYYFHCLPWDETIVFSVAAIIVFLGVAMLRR